MRTSKITFLTSCLAGLSFFLLGPSTFAQFKKYRTQTKIENRKEDKSEDAPQEEKVEKRSASTSPTKKEVLKEDESSGEKDYFGRGTGIKNVKTDPLKDKFVNLNPETAFGPEVITSFDFPDTDILELTKHMQKLTGINLILDKDVKGKVSITAPTPITVGDAWKAYLTALNLNGLAIVKSGAFYKIIQARDARTSPTKIYTGTFTPDTENYVMKIIPLKNIDASEISRNFRQFMSRYGRIVDLKQTNTILVFETGTNINRLLRLINFLDVPGHEETLQIIKVEYSSAQEIAKLLDTILKGNNSRFRGAPAAPQQQSNNISKIIAEPRTNSIIAMANAEGARQLKNLIKKLDVKLVSKSGGQIHVYYLNYGDAETLSKTLSGLVSSSQGARSKFSARPPGAPGAALEDPPLFNSEVKISPDKANNALVVMASPTDYLTIKQIIAKLDIPRQQVYVEGLIMETKVGHENSFGISVMGVYGQGNARKVGMMPSGGAGLTSLLTNDVTNLSGLFYGLGLGKTIELAMGNNQTVKVNSVNGLIQAIASDSNSNVLATPQILALDNEDAVFEVGETVPTLVKETAANGSSVNTPSEQKVALVLKITPQINKVTRMIKLKINQKVDDFSGKFTEGTTGVGTISRQAITNVIVRDRDTIAMGGLMRDRTSDSVAKVPLLGDIPVLGWLFKQTRKTTEKVNLLFFLTPKILAPYEHTQPDNLRDVLNRRSNHLKDIHGDDDPFKKTVKGLYEKSNEQEDGPLYDETLSSDYLNDGAIRSNDDEEGQASAPDYKEIMRKHLEKKVKAKVEVKKVDETSTPVTAGEELAVHDTNN